eukprot:CFRG1434T1
MNVNSANATQHSANFDISFGKNDPYGKLRVLSSYVPRYLLRRLKRQPNRPKDIAEDMFLGVISCVDVSGFTKLSSRLAGKGNDGIEKLQNYLNMYFGQLIMCIHQYGGDIVAFAGDALIALWLVEEKEGPQNEATYMDNMKKAAYASTVCALEIQSTLGEYDINPLEKNTVLKDVLKIHITSGFGHCTGMHVGGFGGAWFWQVSGRPLEQISRIDKFSTSGDVVVSAETWVLIGEKCCGVKVSDKHGAFKITSCNANLLEIYPTRTFAPNSEMEKGLVSYINPSVLHNTVLHMSERVGEIRPATVLFVSCRHVTAINGIHILQKYSIVCQDVSSQYGGIINKILVDEKGTTIIIAFGMPPAGAHGDDPERGVLAALSIRVRLQELKLATSIGVATGRIFCGVYGQKDNRMEYCILGATVNLSARLMGFSQKDILCDRATYESAMDVVEFEIWPPIQLKGISELTPVFRPVRRVGAGATADVQTRDSITVQDRAQVLASRNEQIVARVKELDIIESAIATVKTASRSSAAEVLCIEGEAGAGKTALSVQTMRQCAKLRLKYHFCFADVSDQRPFSAFLGLLKKIFKFGRYEGETDWSSQMGKRVVDYLEPFSHLLEYASLFSPILGKMDDTSEEPTLHIPVSGTVEGLNFRQRREKSVWLVSQVLKKYLERQPCILILDDAQWFDSLSWLVAQIVCFNFTRICVIICSRPVLKTAESTYPDYLRIVQRQGTKLLLLQKMTKAEVAQVCALYLKVVTQQVPLAVVDIVYSKSHGHVQFAKDLVMQMKANKIVTVDNGIVTVVDEKRLGNIETKGIEGVITSQLDKLTHDQKLMVEVASCIGMKFKLAMVADIFTSIPSKTKFKQDELQKNMDAIVQIIDIEYDEVNDNYYFANKTTPDVAYSLLLQKYRREIHNEVAVWIERHYAADLVPHYPTIAYHLYKDNQYARACHYLDMAATTAAKLRSFWETIRFITEAIQIDNKHLNNSFAPKYASWEHLLGASYFGLGRLTEARSHTMKALTLFGASVPRSNTSTLLSLISQAFSAETGRLRPVVPLKPTTNEQFKERIATSAKLARIYAITDTWYTLAVISFVIQDGNMMLISAYRAVTESTGMDVCQLHLNCLSVLSLALGLVKCKRKQQHYLNSRAMKLSKHIVNADLSKIKYARSLYLAGQGELEEAMDVAKQANEGAELSSDNDIVGAARVLIGYIYIWSGRANEAMNVALTLGEKAKSQGVIRMASFANMLACDIRIAEGNLDEAERMANEALQIGGGPSDRLILKSMRALIRLRSGSLRVAEALAQEAYNELVGLPMCLSMLMMETFVMLTFVYLGLYRHSNDRKGAMRKAMKVVELLHDYAQNHSVANPLIYLCMGMIEKCRSHFYKARTLLYKALKYSIAAGLRRVEAWSLTELAHLEQIIIDKKYESASDSLKEEYATRAFALCTEINMLSYYQISYYDVSFSAEERNAMFLVGEFDTSDRDTDHESQYGGMNANVNANTNMIANATANGHDKRNGSTKDPLGTHTAISDDNELGGSFTRAPTVDMVDVLPPTPQTARNNNMRRKTSEDGVDTDVGLGVNIKALRSVSDPQEGTKGRVVAMNPHQLRSLKMAIHVIMGKIRSLLRRET